MKVPIEVSREEAGLYLGNEIGGGIFLWVPEVGRNGCFCWNGNGKAGAIGSGLGEQFSGLGLSEA